MYDFFFYLFLIVFLDKLLTKLDISYFLLLVVVEVFPIKLLALERKLASVELKAEVHNTEAKQSHQKHGMLSNERSTPRKVV